MVLCHWTRWQPCPYMVKRLKSASPELRKLWVWILVYSIGDSMSTKFVEMTILGWLLTFLWYGQICVLVAVAILEENAWHLQICNSFCYQVSESWSMSLWFKSAFQFDFTSRKPFYSINLLTCLTHLSLASHKRDIGKQCTPRSDAAGRGVWSVSTLVALTSEISTKHNDNNQTPLL